MVHYSCDMCGKLLHSDKDVRYVVKVEVYALYKEEDDDFDETEDAFEDELDELEDIDAEMEEFEDAEYKTFRFDLCSECHSKYLQNPLLFKGSRKARFSEN
ncbi:MAG: hypothetical protein ACUZ77_04805 [Candidatus Brocadiales bacterium]